MVSPISLPGLSRPNSDSLSVGQPGRGRNEGASPGVASDQNAIKSEAITIRTADDAMKVLRARLSQRLEQQLGKVPANADVRFSAPSFEAPSAELVARRVLGFVQQRLQTDARAGADTDRLMGLLSAARAGVEQGFTEARDQITAMGLMDDRLGLEIDDSFSRIQKGLDDLLDRFMKPQPPQEPSAVSPAKSRANP